MVPALWLMLESGGEEKVIVDADRKTVGGSSGQHSHFELMVIVRGAACTERILLADANYTGNM